jgi:hypothetical protein
LPVGGRAIQRWSPRGTSARAIEVILPGSQQDFPIVDTGHVVGVLTRGDFLTALA